ncbi:MAG TPA: DoxX family protein, partial [Bacteroidia bacterium]|nr:DoxX family protein [Bacteroidia bacterium]
KSILKGQSKILLFVLTLLEICGGVLCFTGVFFAKNLLNPIGFYGLFLCSISFLSLFLGQRIAKDYAGAAAIPGYFLVCLIGLLSYMI